MKTEPIHRSMPTHPGTAVMVPRRKPASGYILMIVIATSILVITSLSTLARQSLRRGLQAADAERMLQKRWGTRTIQRAMLAEASRVFKQREEQAKEQNSKAPASPVIRSKLVLGNVTFDFLLADEDAKLPLNTLYHHAGKKKTEDGINRVAGSAAKLSTRLIPAVPAMLITRENRKVVLTEDAEEDAEEPDTPDAFRSWGEVFDLATLNTAVGDQAALPACTTDLTCWGSGQLNFGRASDEAILALTSIVVQDGGARRLLQRYRTNPTATLAILLQSEVSNHGQRSQLEVMLSETSTSFSIWIDASSRTGHSFRTFTVMKRDAEGVTQQNRFSL